MNPTKRVVINTGAQYARALINIILSLYSTRLILEALGKDDYGLYVLVGGIVAMLGFVTNALIVSTQRFISFYYGKDELKVVGRYFSNSLFLHLFISTSIGVILWLLQNPLLSFLNFDPSRQTTACSVYLVTIGILWLTIMMAPFKALFIARENIVYISIVEVLDSILKLLLAIFLLDTPGDKLMFYAYMMLIIQVFNIIAYMVYAYTRFEECKLRLRFSDLDKDFLRKLMGFTGWNIFGTGTIMIRNQGIAIILNRQFGTGINAAYGIGYQVFGAVAFVATSLLNAMNPQIIKAEGNNDRKRMLRLSAMESKFSVALMLLVGLPLIVEMPQVLSFWLDEVPDEAPMFCRLILLSFLMDQFSLGLHTANQAKGDIRTYTLLTNIPKLLIVPVAWLLIYWGGTPMSVMMVYLVVELIVSMIRVPFSVRSVGLNAKLYVHDAILPLIVPCCAILFVGLLCTIIFTCSYRFIITFLLSGIVGLPLEWFYTLSASDRAMVQLFIKSRRNKS